MSLRQMQNELAQWGAWARETERTGGVTQYESPCYTMLRRNVCQSRKSGVEITLPDGALMAIDHLITQLRFSRPDLYQWIEAYYLTGATISELAGHLKMSRPAVDKWLLVAETWLDCRLEFLCEKVGVAG